MLTCVTARGRSLLAFHVPFYCVRGEHVPLETSSLGMVVPYKRRKIVYGHKVQVYKNLHKPGWYSVRQRGKVVAHAATISLRDVRFHVNKKGRERVVKTGQKNVHAWVEGFMSNYAHARIGKEAVPVTYNPKLYKSFVRVKDHKKIAKADYAVLYSGGVLACLK